MGIFLIQVTSIFRDLRENERKTAEKARIIMSSFVTIRKLHPFRATFLKALMK
jgi:hypothetical protein